MTELFLYAPETGTLRRPDRAAWGAAETLQDLCDLTIDWLEGRIVSQPGYYGPVDVDEDEAPGLLAALVAVNRAGFATRNSQAGFDGPGFDGAHWIQLAWVTGFAGEQAVDRLRRCLAGTGVLMSVTAAPRNGGRVDETRVMVTFRNDRPVTGGGALTAAEVESELEGAGPSAVRAAAEAFQVTVWDPMPGRNDLWAALLHI